MIFQRDYPGWMREIKRKMSEVVGDGSAVNLYLQKWCSSIEVRDVTKYPVDACIDECDSTGSVLRGSLL
jgi:hypothetical protein